MRSSFLPFSPPSLGDAEIDEVVDTLRSDWITTGPKVRRFEEEFCQFVGAPAALAVSSATDAMLLGLVAFGVGPGDEVITTPLTFCSTVHVIERRGATPVLVDVEPDTLTIDPGAVARAVTPRTRGLLPVHLYGHPCEMDALYDIAARHGLFVLEDAAHSLPAKYKGRLIGGSGAANGLNVPNLTAFSFYATKNLTTAEGGMLTGGPDLIDLVRPWSLHGMSRDAYVRYGASGSWYYEVVLPGFKCNMTDIQASLGLQQLKKLDGFQARRREIVQRYDEAFGALCAVQRPTVRPDVESSWHLYVVRLNLNRVDINRAQFIDELRALNIGASVHFIPNHIQPYYRDKYGYTPQDFPVAFDEYQRLITLPLHPRMSDQDVTDVIEAVFLVAERHAR